MKVTQVRPEHVARMSGKAQTKASLTRGVLAGIAVFGQAARRCSLTLRPAALSSARAISAEESLIATD